MKRLLFVALLALMLVGCRNTGTYAVVGELDAPVDISDGSDTLNIRALFSLTGAKVWSARDTRVTMTYTNCYTNAYLFGMVEKRGRQDFGVEVDPTVDEAEDNRDNRQETGTTETTRTSGTNATFRETSMSSGFVPSVSSVPVVPFP